MTTRPILVKSYDSMTTRLVPGYFLELAVGGWWLVVGDRHGDGRHHHHPPRGISQVNSAIIQTHLASETTFIQYTKSQRVKLKTLGESLCFSKISTFWKIY